MRFIIYMNERSDKHHLTDAGTNFARWIAPLGRRYATLGSHSDTAHSYFMLWDWDGTLERVHHALYVATRDREGREASPTAAIIDSQSAKAAQRGLHA
jgi:hypothetical protein